MNVFKLPDLGEGLQEAEIVQWHVQAGQLVAVDQPLVSVETAKALVDIPSPRSGKVLRLFAKVGEVVPVGAPLLAFEGEGEDTGAVVGAVEVGTALVAESATAETRRPVATSAKAAPAVRALARQLSVDIAVVTPTGPEGTITAEDVRRTAKMLAEAAAQEPLRGVRRAMAQNMAIANAEVAAATVVDDADIDAWPAGTDITIRLIRALVAACRAEPALNAWFDARSMSRRLMTKIDVGIATDTPDGLFVPVLRDVANRDAPDLRRGLDRMIADVKARRVPPEELRGYTITLSNFGMIAGRYAAPVVLPPTVAILGAGRVRPEVVAVNGTPAVHRILPLSLTFDHRAVTGGEAARFLAAAIADLQRAQ
ncbi:MAG TPA: dihydrolipoamide acetyltransferase family protein [Burkholderiales bacterium]|jgi:2-oxoisovalerate dehydrogenase E2 component (dihydrolipoyl transacylase)|nr:dihydrolipoamide acetyltransferase family protein [Burkholderiales bacterium]